MNPGRSLTLVTFLWFICSLIYLLFMHGPGPSGLYLIGKVVQRGREKDAGNTDSTSSNFTNQEMEVSPPLVFP